MKEACVAIWTADDGTAIHYEDRGARPDREGLLLLPGLLGAIGSQWQQFVQPLAARYRVLLPDLRGHGRSENAAGALQPQRLLEDVVGLLDHLEVDRVHVAGYDLGGYLGLMLHLHDPRRVPTLLMHATKFYWTEEAVAQMRDGLDPDALAENVPAYGDRLAQDHGSRWRMLVRQAADLIAQLAQESLTESALRRVQAPVLVSVGDRDEMVPLPEALRLSRIFPHGQLLVLPGVHHPLNAVPIVPLLPMMQMFHRPPARR